MISPYRLTARASVIMNACGGEPGRDFLTNPSPAVAVAWDAHHVGWHLTFARHHLGFLTTRGYTPDSLRWKYIAYRKSRERTRRHIRLAGEFLAKAEAGYAALQLCAVPAMTNEGAV